MNSPDGEVVDEEEELRGVNADDNEETVKEDEVAGGSSSYQPPISAIPPRVTLTEESQMEVSASPAFQCLDDVSLYNREISGMFNVLVLLFTSRFIFYYNFN